MEGLALKTLKLKLKNKDLYLAHISDQIWGSFSHGTNIGNAI